MKSSLFILLCICSIANAESLPEVVDNSQTAEVTAVKPSASNALYEMMGRIEQLQTEVQQLTGKVEEQAYLITEMKKSQNSLYSDFDERIQNLEKKAEAKSTAQNPQLPEDSVTAETNVNEPPPVQASEVKQVPAPKQEVVQAPTPASAPPAGDEKQQYQQAYDALRNGHTAQAISEFNALLAKNSKGEFASNAQYWLGEAYRVNQDVDLARQAFAGVVENYPDSTKVPDALLKLGSIEFEQKNTKKAREYLTRVTMDYSGSTAAHLAAKKLLLLDDVKY